jgi:drug/metabolite transporter (DMT)-like permease
MPLKHFGQVGIEGPIVTLGAHGTVALMALPLLLRWRSQWLPHPKSMLVIGFFGGLANLAFAWAMVIGDVTRVMVLFYLLPAWGVLGGRVVLGETIDLKRGSSLTLALVGAFLVLGGPRIVEAPPGLADLLATLAGFALASTNIAFRKLQQIPVPTKIAMNFVGCLLWASALVLLGVARVPDQVEVTTWLQLSGFGYGWILLATAGTLWAVHHMEAGRSSVLIIMELVVAVASAAAITGELLSGLEWVGAAMILASALLEALSTGSDAELQPQPAA